MGEVQGQEEDEDSFMAHWVQVYEATEAEHEALKWLAANPTQHEVDSESLVSVGCNIDLFPNLAGHDNVPWASWAPPIYVVLLLVPY